MTLVYIHQPDFMPWPVFFRRIALSDLYIVLDNVQFIRRGWHNRDQVKTARGTCWLTVPVQQGQRQAIREIKIASGTGWKKKHLRTLSTWYRPAPFFKEFFPLVEAIYDLPFEYLLDLNLELITFFLQAFDIHKEIILASEMNLSARKTDLLLEIIKKVNGDKYLTGTGARTYLERQKFRRAGIKIIWDEFNFPVYQQRYNSFIPGLSAIDFLFNCGPDLSAHFLADTPTPLGY